MAEVSKQDIQTMLDQTLTKFVARALTKNDVQIIANQMRDRILSQLQLMHQIDRQVIKQSFTLADQSFRRTVTVEGRLAALEQELRLFRVTLERVLERQMQTMARPLSQSVPRETVAGTTTPANQYQATSQYANTNRQQ